MLDSLDEVVESGDYEGASHDYEAPCYGYVVLAPDDDEIGQDCV